MDHLKADWASRSIDLEGSFSYQNIPSLFRIVEQHYNFCRRMSWYHLLDVED